MLKFIKSDDSDGIFLLSSSSIAGNGSRMKNSNLGSENGNIKCWALLVDDIQSFFCNRLK